MRVSNHAARLAAGAAVALIVMTCCASPPASSPPVTPRPTPVITPDPHLTDPATADDIFRAIRVGGLPLHVTNATSGDPNSPVVKRINADIGNWPLIISEYRTSALLRESLKWDPKAPLAQGNPPYAFVGMNILVEFGPVTGLLSRPDNSRQKQAEGLVALIDPLLWPLEQRSLLPLPVKTPAPATAVASPPAVASPKP